ncbi:hypothetical protein JYU34_015607 [Plutella xylostella]|uniref:Peptidase M16 N-terminal domain-containing protein n=1 Tax=Plutella xylostella TaxID=51655 RepID=A0ABQ7Q4C2_PLUXY|nr:hypothetical protein JYU34_015607 [Plutella xylostella]
MSTYIRTKLLTPPWHIPSRRVATSARARSLPQPDYGPAEIRRSELSNGIKMAVAQPWGAPMAACTIMYRAAGSRFEADSSLGASHFLRACSDCSGRGSSGYLKTRDLMQHGAALACSTDRQTVSYTLTCVPSDFQHLKYYLLDAACRCSYPQHEIDDRKDQIRGDLTRISPDVRVMDLVQKAAFKGGLSNSTFCVRERIDAMSQCVLTTYVAERFRTCDLAIGSFGLGFDEVMKLAESVDIRKSKSPADPRSAWRAGQESHDMGRDADTYIALAVPGAGTQDFGREAGKLRLPPTNLSPHLPSSLLKLAILSSALGSGSMTSNHELDVSTELPVDYLVDGDVFTSYSTFNLSYSDAGIFGVLAKTRACSAASVAHKAASFLRDIGQIDLASIDAGKRRLQLNLSLHYSDPASMAEDLAFQCGAGAAVDGAKDAIAKIHATDPSDVKQMAVELPASIKTTLAMAVVGDVPVTPFREEIIDKL